MPLVCLLGTEKNKNISLFVLPFGAFNGGAFNGFGVDLKSSTEARTNLTAIRLALNAGQPVCKRAVQLHSLNRDFHASLAPRPLHLLLPAQ
jgi:hypothetical protein